MKSFRILTAIICLTPLAIAATAQALGVWDNQGETK